MKTFEVSILLKLADKVVALKLIKLTIRATHFIAAMEQVTDYGIRAKIADSFYEVKLTKTADY